jgi:hypothetical protein
METRRWTNPSQPQTLQIAVMLLYFRAVFGLIFGSSLVAGLAQLLGRGPGLLLGGVAMAGLVAAGFGIANERKWGYQLAVGLAALDVGLYLVIFGPFGVFRFGVLIGFAFSVALAALLLHPQSRDYQRIWFS